MIESEAREKWCPFAAGTNNVPEGENCIASNCMAWRETDNEYLPQPPEYTGDNPSYPAGYCGLAGKP